MVNTDHQLNILIKSIFDATGFERLNKAVRSGSNPVFETQRQVLQRVGTTAKKTSTNFNDLRKSSFNVQEVALQNSWLEKYGATLNRSGNLVSMFNKRQSISADVMRKVARDISHPVKGYQAYQQSVMNAQMAGEGFFTRFQAWTLGFIFGGMVIQRFFRSILTAGVMTYNKLLQGQSRTADSLTMLSAQWTYLKFAVGDAISTALEPLLPTIIRLVQTFVDWISQHQKLVTWVLILGVAIGTALMIFGQLFAFLNSFAMLITNFPVLVGLLGKAFVFFGKVTGKVIYLIGDSMYRLIVYLKNTIVPGAISAVKTLATFLFTNPIGLAILTIVGILGWFLIKWKGNWKAALADFVAFSVNVLKWVTKAGAALVGAFDVSFGLIRDIFAKFFNWVFEKWNLLVDKIAKNQFAKKVASTLGVDLSKAKIDFRFDTENMQQAIGRFSQVQEGINESFGEKIREWQELAETIAKHDSIANGESLNQPFDVEADHLDLKKQMAEFESQMNESEVESLELQKDKTEELEKQYDLLSKLNDLANESNSNVQDIIAEIQRRSTGG